MLYKQLKPFPQKFLWGASTSAYQVEGAADTDGKGKSVIDWMDHPEGTAGFTVASDHYHRYKEDIRLFHELGLKAYRFSIAWTRIFPEGTGTINEEGLAHYEQVIDELLHYGIEPIVTLYHFDLPYALEEQGGWNNRKTIDAFVEYAKVLFTRLGRKVNYWLTINEQNTLILHPGAVGIPKGGQLPSKKELYQQNHHMLIAQGKALALCHQICPHAKIGPALNMTSMYQATSKPEDALAAHNWETIRGWSFLDLAVHGRYNHLLWSYLEERDWQPDVEEGDLALIEMGQPDFIAINYYSTATIAESTGSASDVSPRAGDQQIMLGEPGVYRAEDNPYVDKTKYGWVIDPVGLRLTLRKVYERYHLPILITENGIGAPDTLEEDGTVHDDYRIAFIRAHLEQVQWALTDGVDVFGYCPWAAMDVVSTHQGYGKRYGFIYVNRGEFDLLDLKRIKKDSFFWYKRVIESNGTDGLFETE